MYAMFLVSHAPQKQPGYKICEVQLGHNDLQFQLNINTKYVIYDKTFLKELPSFASIAKSSTGPPPF